MEKIMIQVGNLAMAAELNNTPTARKILEALPIESTVNVWGEEIYFDISLEIDLEPEARAEVEVGALAYWPTGTAFCIFFGPTPVSTDAKPRAYSPVNIFGHVSGDPTRFKAVASGAKIRITRAQV
ncbi:MAG: hypothetical protein JSW39_24990 [Desulfobacterales bacterium]|nr:MAG: hypothetical protein JSW39_24990 [Desulfobacterales bacterium]